MNKILVNTYPCWNHDYKWLYSCICGTFNLRKSLAIFYMIALLSPDWSILYIQFNSRSLMNSNRLKNWPKNITNIYNTQCVQWLRTICETSKWWSFIIFWPNSSLNSQYSFLHRCCFAFFFFSSSISCHDD